MTKQLRQLHATHLLEDNTAEDRRYGEGIRTHILNNIIFITDLTN